MFKIGLTGGIASGKTTVSKLFAQHGIPILDADIIAHELVRLGSPALTEIIHTFGPNILTPQGTLNRPLLRRHIFNTPQAKQQLESILHPKIRQTLKRRSHALSAPYCLLVIPLLIEAKMVDLVDQVLTIETENSIQIKRLTNRDNIDLSLAESMIENQSRSAQRQQTANNIIHNSGNKQQLHQTVSLLHQHYLKQAKLHNQAN